jgi:membrane associated rhomboid family serine protease
MVKRKTFALLQARMVMGIYDRDYYRRDGSGFMVFTNRGTVCKWLIAINVVVFLLQVVTKPVIENGELVGSGFFTDAFVLDPSLVLQGQVWRVLTYAFLHDPGSLWHILFNMLFLWWFGSDMEDLLGAREFLAFYLIAAVLGGLGFMLAGFIGGQIGVCLGASGAVTAVLVLCACYYPSRMILVFFLPVPIWLFVGFQVAQDAFAFLSNARTTTAVSVHLAGALFGFSYFRLHWRLMNFWPNWKSWRKQQRRPRLRVYDEEPVSTAPVAQRHEADEHLEAKLDAILQKVAEKGQDSLTENEKKILIQASEIYKRRRS